MPKSSASEIWNRASIRLPSPTPISPGAMISSPKAKRPGLQGASTRLKLSWQRNQLTIAGGDDRRWVRSRGEPGIPRPDALDLPFGLLKIHLERRGLRALLTRRFPQPGCQTVVAPRGDVRQDRTGKRPPHFLGFRCQAFGTASALTRWLSWRGGAGVTSASASAPVFLHLPFLPLHRNASVSGGVYCPMGWQQYSRPLWLSRRNHYILYLKAITVQMRIGVAGFPQVA